MALRSRPAKPRPTRLKPNLKGFGDSESPTTHFVGTPIANPSCVGVLSRLPAELGKCTGLGKVGMYPSGKARTACRSYPFSHRALYRRSAVRSLIARETRLATCYCGILKLVRCCSGPYSQHTRRASSREIRSSRSNANGRYIASFRRGIVHGAAGISVLVDALAGTQIRTIASSSLPHSN